MADAAAPIEIPKRALFKAAEVCELLKIQPYVLRTWEAEFPELGIAKSPDGPRVYRREDVEQVMRIRHLLLVEGLTLAGARRRLEEESGLVAANVPVIDELIGRNARERLTEVKRGLRSILDLLSGRIPSTEFTLAPPPVRPSSPRHPASGNGKGARRRGAPPAAPPPPSPRRKRSA